MLKRSRPCGLLVCILGMGIAASAEAVPTFSLEATAVNSTPIAGGPVSRVAASPGDIITMEAYVRDWSPDGDTLAAYQVQIDPEAFSSGTAGRIAPIDYDVTQQSGEENNANCFIDKQHPRFVHAGLETLPLTDTRSEGYRWASVLLGIRGPVSPEDGTKFYCATLKLQVSDDAQGTFTIVALEDPISSGLRDNTNRAITPVEFEPLTIVAYPSLAAVIDGLNGAADVLDSQVDVDRNGAGGPTDVFRVITMVNGGE